MKQGTLCFLIKDDQVLLAMKKRGFGKEKWNGAGGKVLEGEKTEDSVLRELEEEVGVSGSPEDLTHVALLKFRSENPEYNWDVHAFFLKKWGGDPMETEEMRPAWFAFEQIPYSAMWIDDKHWLPLVLAGKKIEAEFLFNNDASDFIKYEVKETT